MNCNFGVHEELKSMEEVTCPFCDKELQESSVKYESCCKKQNVTNDNSMFVCRSCGIVHGYDIAKEYIDFHEKRKIVKKSVYNRKYHIQNTINDICSKYRLQISINNRHKIYQVFSLINNILLQINATRERMIKMNFILKQLFIMLELPYDKIPISKSKRALALYEQYWTNIQSLIGDKIQSIIDR